MKIKLSTKAMQNALARLGSIPGASTAIIQTQAVGLSADLAGLTLSRYTCEASISITIDEDIEVSNDEGTPRVNHGALTALVNACNGKEVLIYQDAKFLHLESGKSKWKLKTFDEDILAEPPELELETEHINFLLEDLTELLSYVAPATSNDENGKLAFCGVNIQHRDSGLFFVGTDTTRFHMAVAPYDLKVNCTVPNTGVDAILKVIGKAKGAATLAVSDNFITVTSSDMEISITLLNVSFPDVVGTLLSKSESSIKSKVKVVRDEFIEALESCANINDTKIVNLRIERDRADITCNNAATAGDREGYISLDCTATAPVFNGISAVALASALKKLMTDKDGLIELNFTESAVFCKQPERMAFFALAKPQP